jgi:hypothetical protein
MDHGHGHAAWTRTSSPDMDMQHEHRHAAWTRTYIQPGYGHLAWTSSIDMVISMVIDMKIDMCKETDWDLEIDHYWSGELGQFHP